VSANFDALGDQLTALVAAAVLKQVGGAAMGSTLIQRYQQKYGRLPEGTFQ
jgi:hypothetical protein